MNLQSDLLHLICSMQMMTQTFVYKKKEEKKADCRNWVIAVKMHNSKTGSVIRSSIIHKQTRTGAAFVFRPTLGTLLSF